MVGAVNTVEAKVKLRFARVASSALIRRGSNLGREQFLLVPSPILLHLETKYSGVHTYSINKLNQRGKGDCLRVLG
jgi:hypothetical protein